MFYCEIISGLWISDIDAMYSKEFLQDNTIDIIINCTINYNFPDNHITKIRIPLSEMMNERDIYLLQKNIQKIIDYIDANIDTKHILLCCYNGKIISPLLAAIYVNKTSTVDKKSIMESFQTKHSDITFPHDLDLF